MNQATALQSLFVRLVELGMAQSVMPNIEGFMRLGLRAQSQCRATLEALAAIKNPPIIYAKQANVTSGPQQINNGIAAPSQARELKASKPNYQVETMSYYRTPEHRAKRAELIRLWKPWEKSTGPKSSEGKERSAMRGFKGEHRVMLRGLARLLTEQGVALKKTGKCQIKSELLHVIG